MGRRKIFSCNDTDIRVGLESTGHYSYNLLGFLHSKKLPKEIRNLARKSVGVYVSAKVLELRHTIKRIQNYMQELHSPLESIAGISFRFAAVIEAEIGDFQRFSSPNKILAFAGLSPSTYQSGKFTSQNAVILSHVAKKLVRFIFHLQRTGEPFSDFV